MLCLCQFLPLVVNVIFFQRILIIFFTQKFQAPHFLKMKPIELQQIYDGEYLRNTKGYLMNIFSIQFDFLVCLIVQEGVEHIPRRAHHEFEQLSRIKMADTVKTIGPYAFAHCTHLHEISWSSNLESIGDYAFFCCDELGSVGFGCTNFIPPSWRRIGESAFTYCMGLDVCIVPHDTRLD